MSSIQKIVAKHTCYCAECCPQNARAGEYMLDLFNLHLYKDPAWLEGRVYIGSSHAFNYIIRVHNEPTYMNVMSINITGNAQEP